MIGRPLTAPHPWQPGMRGRVVRGRWEGVAGIVTRVYPDADGDLVLLIQPNGWKDSIEVDAGDVIPWP